MVVDVEFCRLLTWKERGGARLACCPCIWWVYLSHPFIGLIGIYEPWLLFLFQDGYCYALDILSMVDSHYNYTCLVSLFDDRMVWLKWGCFHLSSWFDFSCVSFWLLIHALMHCHDYAFDNLHKWKPLHLNFGFLVAVMILCFSIER